MPYEKIPYLKEGNPYEPILAPETSTSKISSELSNSSHSQKQQLNTSCSRSRSRSRSPTLISSLGARLLNYLDSNLFCCTQACITTSATHPAEETQQEEISRREQLFETKVIAKDVLSSVLDAIVNADVKQKRVELSFDITLMRNKTLKQIAASTDELEVAFTINSIVAQIETRELELISVRSVMDEVVFKIVSSDAIHQQQQKLQQLQLEQEARELAKKTQPPPKPTNPNPSHTRDVVAAVITNLIGAVESQLLRAHVHYLTKSIMFEKEIRKQRNSEARKKKQQAKKEKHRERRKSLKKKEEEEEKEKEKEKKEIEKERTFSPSDYFDATEFLVSNQMELERAQVELSLSMLVHAVELKVAAGDLQPSPPKSLPPPSSSSLLTLLNLEYDLEHAEQQLMRTHVESCVEHLITNLELESLKQFHDETVHEKDETLKNLLDQVILVEDEKLQLFHDEEDEKMALIKQGEEMRKMLVEESEQKQILLLVEAERERQNSEAEIIQSQVNHCLSDLVLEIEKNDRKMRSKLFDSQRREIELKQEAELNRIREKDMELEREFIVEQQRICDLHAEQKQIEIHFACEQAIDSIVHRCILHEKDSAIATATHERDNAIATATHNEETHRGDIENLNLSIDKMKFKLSSQTQNLLSTEAEKRELEEELQKQFNSTLNIQLEKMETQKIVLENKLADELENQKLEFAREKSELEKRAKAEREELQAVMESKAKSEREMLQASHEAAITQEGLLIKSTMEDAFTMRQTLQSKEAELSSNEAELAATREKTIALEKQISELTSKSDMVHQFETFTQQLQQSNHATANKLLLEEKQREKVEKQLVEQKLELERVRTESQLKIEENLTKLSEAVEKMQIQQEEQLASAKEEIAVVAVADEEKEEEEEEKEEDHVQLEQELELQKSLYTQQLNEKTQIETDLKNSQIQLAQMEEKTKSHDENLQQLKKALRRVVSMKQLDYTKTIQHEQELSALTNQLVLSELDKKNISEQNFEAQKLLLQTTEEVEKERQNKKKLVAQLHESFKDSTSNQTETKDLKNVLKNIKQQQTSERNNFHKMLQRLKDEVKEVNLFKEELELVKLSKEKLMNELKKEQEGRKANYNLLQDLQGKIRVFVRCRPMLNNEIEQSRSSVKITSKSCLEITTSKSKNNRGPMEFTFDEVLGAKVSQEDVFEKVEGLIGSVIDGFNVTIFAYGQTGSGKTYTMAGSTDSNTEAGIIPRSITKLFQQLKQKSLHYDVAVKSYFVELYCNKLIDLFAPSSKHSAADDHLANEKKLDIKLDATRMVYVKNAVMKTAEDAADLISFWAEGESTKRHSASTNMNDASSRSHSVLSIIVEVKSKTTGTVSTGKLSLIDLAGSEKVNKSGVTGVGLQEAKNINTSLSCLSDVIAALSNGNKHIPYRNNKLTQLMQDSLGGNAKTLMFVNISPADSNSEESVMSLHYGSRAKMIKNNAKKNEESSEVGRLKNLVEGLRSELAASREDGAGEGKEVVVKNNVARPEEEVNVNAVVPG